jgi:hypothetical protein
MTIHALRHTASSNDFDTAIVKDIANINRYPLLSERKGHIAAPMGFAFYTHSFEQHLYIALKKCSISDITFSSVEAAEVIGKASGASRTIGKTGFRH